MLLAQPKFVCGGAGRLFVMDYQPAAPIRGSVLFAAPFAEEMNRSRRMTYLQSRMLVAMGYQVLVPDYYGTGDSEGAFEDGSWALWKSDLAIVLKSLVIDPALPVCIWGLRLGALLVLEAIVEQDLDSSMAVLWNPCISGSTFMSQFLRMRTLAGMIADTADKESVPDMRARLQKGDSLEVAGYELRPDMVSAIDNSSIEAPVLRTHMPLHWFDLIADPERGMSPTSTRLIGSLQEKGRNIATHAVEGPAFWATPEISIAPKLLVETSAIFEQPGS